MARDNVQSRIDRIIRDTPFMIPESHLLKIIESSKQIADIGLQAYLDSLSNPAEASTLRENVTTTDSNNHSSYSPASIPDFPAEEQALPAQVIKAPIDSNTSREPGSSSDNTNTPEDSYKVNGIVTKEDGSETRAYDPDTDPDFWRRLSDNKKMSAATSDYLNDLAESDPALDRKQLAETLGFASFVPTKQQISAYKMHYGLSESKLKDCFTYLQDNYDESEYKEHKAKTMAQLPAAIARKPAKEQDRYCRARYETEKTSELLQAVNINWYVHDHIFTRAGQDINPPMYIAQMDKKTFMYLLQKNPPEVKFYNENKETYVEAAWEKFAGIQKLYQFGFIVSKMSQKINDIRHNGADIIQLGAKLGSFDLRELVQSLDQNNTFFGDAELKDVQDTILILDAASALVKKDQTSWQRKLFTYTAIDGTRTAISYGSLTAMLTAPLGKEIAGAVAAALYCRQQEAHNIYLEKMNGSSDSKAKGSVNTKNAYNIIEYIVKIILNILPLGKYLDNDVANPLKRKFINKSTGNAKDILNKLADQNDKRINPFGSPEEIILDSARQFNDKTFNPFATDLRTKDLEDQLNPFELKKLQNEEKEREEFFKKKYAEYRDLQ